MYFGSDSPLFQNLYHWHLGSKFTLCQSKMPGQIKLTTMIWGCYFGEISVHLRLKNELSYWPEYTKCLSLKWRLSVAQVLSIAVKLNSRYLIEVENISILSQNLPFTHVGLNKRCIGKTEKRLRPLLSNLLLLLSPYVYSITPQTVFVLTWDWE